MKPDPTDPTKVTQLHNQLLADLLQLLQRVVGIVEQAIADQAWSRELEADFVM